jgi:DNA-binding MarR family transcriptional regulator
MAKAAKADVATWLMRVCTHLSKYDREMSIAKLQIFLQVAKKGKEGALVKDLMRVTGLNQSSVARTLAHLGEKTTRGQTTPLRWVDMRPDPEDPRRVRCHITSKGDTVLAELENL